MKVKAGYKQTELGIIPKDWEISELKECTTKLNVGFVGVCEPFYTNASSSVLLIRTGNLRGDKLDLSEVKYVTKEFHDANKKSRVRAGDILIARHGYSGNAVLVPDQIKDANTLNIVILRTDNSKLLNRFAGYAINSDAVKKQAADKTAGSTQGVINTKEIAVLKVAVPPTHEQQAIAEVLSDADALIEALEQLIAKKRQVKQGAMQELLTGKRRLPGFTKKWNEKKLGDIAEITKLAGFEYSKYFNSYKDGGDIIVIRGTNITHNRLDLSDIKTIPQSTSNFLQRSKLQKGDLVFAYVGTIGPVYLITENNKYHLGPNTARITVKDNISSQFVFWYFCSNFAKKEIDEHISVGAQPSLSMTKIRKFKISLPEYSEQIAIAEILSDMDAEITALEGKLSKARQVKQGMMQELLTGRVRLV